MKKRRKKVFRISLDLDNDDMELLSECCLWEKLTKSDVLRISLRLHWENLREAMEG